MSIRFLHLVFWIIFLSNDSISQYQLGMRLEKNAGLYGLSVNPSSPTLQPKKWDIHLGSAGVFLDNNYAYLKNANVTRILNNRENLNLIFDQPSTSDQTFELDFNDNNASRFLHAKAFVMGPSVAYHLNEKHTIGLFAQGRSAFSITRIPNEFSYNKITNRRHFDPFEARPFGGALMNWAEYGINYGQKFENNTDASIAWGLNLKYIHGYDLLYFNTTRPFTHTITGLNSFSMGSPDFSFGYTDEQNILSEPRGKGGAIDFGFSYLAGKNIQDYDYKIGIALVDLGFVVFKTGINTYRFVSDSTIHSDGDDYQNLSSNTTLDELTDIFVQNSIGQIPELTTGTDKRIYMPFVLNLQFDYKISSSVYINGTWIQPIKFSASSVRGVDLIAITPRIERTWYAISLPISVIEKKVFRVGLAARLAYLTIGTENLSSFLFRKDFYGSDLYVGFKFGFGDTTTRYKRKKNKNEDCYPF